MTELEAALQRLADRADDAALPTAATIRAAGERRTRRTAVAVAGIAVAAVVAVVVVLTGLPGRDRDDSVPPVDRTRTSAPTPSGLSSATQPELLTPDWGVEYVGVNATAARGSTFVVVADTSFEQLVATPVWWSDDGRTWRRASGVVSGNVTDVIATGAGFLATGIDGNGAAMFWSDDGETWEQTLDVPRRGQVDALWGVAETDLGFFAWGHVGGRPVLYRSSDGRAWTASDLRPPPGRAKDTRLCAIEDTTGRLVATGGVQDGRLGPERLATWASDDGSAWNLVEVTGDNAVITCNALYEAHWSATTDVGTVSVDPNGDGEVLYFEPPS